MNIILKTTQPAFAFNNVLVFKWVSNELWTAASSLLRLWITFNKLFAHTNSYLLIYLANEHCWPLAIYICVYVCVHLVFAVEILNDTLLQITN